MSSSYDAIIIGSGLDGLSCGAYLAKNGKKVLMLERHSTLDGYSTVFKRGDYIFDASLHMIEGVGKGQSVARFFECCGVDHDIEFVKLKYFLRTIFPDLDIRFPSGDLEGVIKVLADKFPDETKGIGSFFQEMIGIFEDLMRFIPRTVSLWKQLPTFPFRYRFLFPIRKKTVKQILDKYLENERLKAVLFANYCFFGLPPSKLNVFSLAGNIDYLIEGAYYPKRGNQAISDAFIKVIKRYAGEIRFDSAITTILCENGKALGVVTEKGEKFFGKHIISNANEMETFHNLIGNEELSRFPLKMDKTDRSVSVFTVYLGLDEDFKSALNDSEDFEIIVSETYDQDKDYQWILSCEVEKASFLITLYSNVDESLATKNRFVASLSQGQSFDYWKKYENDYLMGNKEEYNAEKDRMASILLNRTERIIPELSRHIEIIEIATPLTLKKYTGKSNVAVSGWGDVIKQFRLADGMKIPIKNFHVCSAWTFPKEALAPMVARGYRVGRGIVDGRESVKFSKNFLGGDKFDKN